MNIEYFKQKLQDELKLVDSELRDTEKSDIDQSATQPDEIADRIEEQEEAGEEAVTLGARKIELEAALERIEMGTYGKCIMGGEQIEEERLEANPAAATCTAHM